MDTVSALYDCYPAGKICILNFASYKNPGGGFLRGSRAQEESLCHESTLYPVLSSFSNSYYEYNRNHSNRSLYTNRALYSKNILFLRDKELYADVLTCAAPNYGAYFRYNSDIDSRRYYEDVLYARVRFIYDIASVENVDTFILGAWGCGVFKQNAEQIANMMFRSAASHNIPNVIFAVPDYRSDNYCAFEKVLHGFGEDI